MYNTMYQYYDAIQPPETLLPQLLAMEPEPRRAATPWRVVVPAAACLALAAVAAGLLLPPKQTDPVSLGQPTHQVVQQTAAPETPDTAEMDTPETEQKQVPEIDQQPVLETGEAQLPQMDSYYEHNEDGDYLTLVIAGATYSNSETIDITGQLVDGQYVGHTHFRGIDEIIYLTVYEDGSYEVQFEAIPCAPQEIPGEVDEKGTRLVIDP